MEWISKGKREYSFFEFAGILGIGTTVTVNPNQYLLDMLQKAGIKVNYHKRNGRYYITADEAKRVYKKWQEFQLSMMEKAMK